MSSNNIYEHTCEKCQQSYSSSAKWGSKRFCSRACANSRTKTQAQKDLARQQMLGRKLKPESIEKGLATKRAKGKIQLSHPCIVCGGSVFKSNKRTCSRECWIESKRLYALKQETHGGGHKGKYKGIMCDSTYELAFLVWHLDQGIDIKRCESVYQYTYKDKTSSYKPDFVVEGQEVEIKGFMSNRAQAKLEQNPHVFVVDKVDIQPFIKYVKSQYHVKDLRDLYDTNNHQTVCDHCSRIFTPGYKSQKYCSYSCSASARHATKKLVRGRGFEPR